MNEENDVTALARSHELEQFWIRGAHGDYHLVTIAQDDVITTWCDLRFDRRKNQPVRRRELSEYFDAFHDECIRADQRGVGLTILK